MTSNIPTPLRSWREAPRVRVCNDAPIASSGRYVLCWLQQALRAVDNPVIDAAVILGNELRLPVLVYHGVREDYPHASDRLHSFILGASRDLAKDCAARGLACVQFVDRPAKRERGLVYRLAADAAAVVVEDQPAFVAQWQSERFASRAAIAVIAVNAACVVPPAALDRDIGTTSAFRRRHGKVRADWFAREDAVADVAVYDGSLPFELDRLGDMDDAGLAALVAGCGIDHSLPVATGFPPSRAEVADRLRRLREEVLPKYAGARNSPDRAEGASALSPYLHFGLVGPREVVASVIEADAPDRSKEKFLDELLTWREWFHYRALSMRVPESYERVPDWARRELAAHAADERPGLETLEALTLGTTADETWNACQRQFLIDGWMHNNLRMYWSKRLIAMTPSPEAGWATACHLNDRLSLDGRDPSTYGNIAWAFGDAAPGHGRKPVYGLVPGRSDGAIRKRAGDAWIAEQAGRTIPAVTVPDVPPVDPYLTGQVPI